MLLGEFLAELLELRADCDQRSAGRANLTDDLRQSRQLGVAVGSPLAAVEA
jgi:hypothetical protein